MPPEEWFLGLIIDASNSSADFEVGRASWTHHTEFSRLSLWYDSFENGNHHYSGMKLVKWIIPERWMQTPLVVAIVMWFISNIA